jgi:hypothetical protein
MNSRAMATRSGASASSSTSPPARARKTARRMLPLERQMVAPGTARTISSDRQIAAPRASISALARPSGLLTNRRSSVDGRVSLATLMLAPSGSALGELSSGGGQSSAEAVSTTSVSGVWAQTLSSNRAIRRLGRMWTSQPPPESGFAMISCRVLPAVKCVTGGYASGPVEATVTSMPVRP